MNKFLVFSTALLLCSGIGVRASNTVAITSVEGTPDAEVTVSITLENSDAVSSLQLSIPLDENLSYVEGSVATGSRCSSHAVSAGTKSGMLNVLLYSLSMTTIPAGSGEVMSFRLKLGNQPANTVLRPTKMLLADGNGTQIDASAVGGTVITRCAKAEYSTMTVDFGHIPIRSTYTQTVTVRNTGNADLTVTSMDFTDVNVFSTTNALPFVVAPGESKALNVTYAPVERGSIERSLKVVCNSVSKLNTIKLKADPYAVNELHIQPASGNSDEEVTVSITMNNMDAVSGMQVEFDMPDALEYVDGSFAISPDRKQDHVSVVSLTGSKLRIVVYSPSDKPFTGNDGIIGSLRVRLKGPYNVELTPSKTVLTATIHNMVENVLSTVYGAVVSINSPDINTENVLDFGAVSVTNPCETKFTIRNYGSAPLTVSRIVFSDERLSIKESLPLVISTWNAVSVTAVYNNLEEAPFESVMQIYSSDPDLRLKEVKVKGSRFAPNYLSVSTPGTFVSSPLSIDLSMDNYDPVTGLQFDLEYPDDRYEVADNGYQMKERAQGMTVTSRRIDAHTQRYFCYFLSNGSIAVGSGEVMRLQLSPVGGTVPIGTYQVKVKNIKMGTASLTDKYAGTDLTHSFEVKDYVLGDVDDDGVVDLADAVLVINYYVGKPVTKFVETAADVDGDGVIDLADAVKIINFYVGKIPSLSHNQEEQSAEHEPQ